MITYTGTYTTYPLPANLDDYDGAHAYDLMEHAPDNPLVADSYAALIAVILEQFDHLRAQLVFTFGPTEYPNSQAMRDDVNRNAHLFTLKTAPGDLPSDHPMAAYALTYEGTPLMVNDVFRAVHDVYGHVRTNSGFGPKGEFTAYLAHRATLPTMAHLALWCETRGQNLWTNFANAHATLPLSARPFAEQRAGIVAPIFY